MTITINPGVTIGSGVTVKVPVYVPPPVPKSLSWDGTQQYVQVTGNKGDWNLGDNWTIEWWENMPSGSAGTGFRGVMSQDSNVQPYAGIDIFHEGGRILMFNSAWKIYTRALSSTEVSQNFQALRNRFGI